MLKLALVGRPNVGKSALFNRICRRKIAIVDEKEGTTRDRLYGEGQIHGFSFEVIDTGGIDPTSSDPLKSQIIESTYLGVEDADTIIMMVDGKADLTALDEQIAKFLLTTKKPVCLAVNKVDSFNEEINVHNFYQLGIKKIIAISVLQGLNIEELLENAWKGFTLLPSKEDVKKPPTLSVLGRPNVGKSTLINSLIGSQRLIVSPIAGTTVDAVQIPCTLKGTDYVLIDTAGVRRKKKEKELIEKWATFKREKALSFSDITLLVCNAQEGFTQEEKKIAKDILDAGRGCIVLFNKWDLIHGFRMEHCLKGLRDEHPLLADLPLIFISAKGNRNLNQIINTIENVRASYTRQIPTPALNKALRKAYEQNSPPVLKSKRLMIYYMTQISVSPPRFILFVNDPKLMSLSYKRYLTNEFRKAFDFTGVPIELILRGKKVKEKSE